MNYDSRIEDVRKRARRIPYNDASRFVFISDCHRNDGSEADQFMANRNHYNAALEHYYRQGFTYIELGDGDDLWECRRMRDITTMQSSSFFLLRRFYDERRLHVIYGNHDLVKKDAAWTENNLQSCRAPHRRQCEPLFPGLKSQEGLVLQHASRAEEILLLHGHQADFLNDRLWKVSRFLVRYFWRPLELIGVKNPTSASINESKCDSVERALIGYCKRHNQVLIAGHTHRPAFPVPGGPPYFNDGSCVHPYYITAIELDRGCLSLVEWSTSTREDGVLRVARKVLEGPLEVHSLFS